MNKLKQFTITDINKSSKIIAILNILSGILFLIPAFYFFLSSIISNAIDPADLKNTGVLPFGVFIYSAIALVLGGLNLFLGYKLIKDRKDQKKILPLSLIAFHLLIWPIIFFIGYFQSTQILFPIITLLLSLINLLVVWNHNNKLSLVLFIITMIITFYTIFTGFEENYCWQLADKASDKDISYPVLTKHEKEFVGTNTTLTGWLRIHLRCHDQFSWSLVLNDILFHTNSIIQINPTIVKDKPRDKVIDYEVVDGDTLELIAQKFNISADTIRWANNLQENSLLIGQSLKILPVTGVTHIVKKGETIETIAKTYRVNSNKIVDFPYNNFSGNKNSIIPGQMLYIPEGIPPDLVIKNSQATQMPSKKVTIPGDWKSYTDSDTDFGVKTTLTLPPGFSFWFTGSEWSIHNNDYTDSWDYSTSVFRGKDDKNPKNYYTGESRREWYRKYLNDEFSGNQPPFKKGEIISVEEFPLNNSSYLEVTVKDAYKGELQKHFLYVQNGILHLIKPLNGNSSNSPIEKNIGIIFQSLKSEKIK